MNEPTRPPDEKKPWIKLCEQASVEQDPEKLIELVQEIILMLERYEKHSTLKSVPDHNRLRKEA